MSGEASCRHRPRTPRRVPHDPDEAANYNESTYLNAFDDLDQAVGGWFRLGNRPNEGHAEMTVCIYLPGGRVGFLYGRPSIDGNTEMLAGGLAIEVVTPFEHLRVTYDGNVCLLDEPGQMVDPRRAFRENPMVTCSVELDFRAVPPMFGGQQRYEDGSEIEVDPDKSFGGMVLEDGEQLVTRLTEAMSRYRCDGRTGIGMSEYLDQIVDGEPVGPDVR